ncbi:response regulator transcription factor [Streptomyces rapamycinicus]|uniref:LuxR family transcriptional regulator n=2 Tax=Streptomyces rapamycinicus TaxID=1226757 RepID=A0A0A0NQF1_STRRN|nr:response regulator transcription factor [Streptomyces rapamycinicus]AGP58398.1 LuxR family transcriptional regulator [Streptomyces rapamycinicus NRRL 5491]MBB4786098.1 DNA-binding NarL/FixJ family response regulator [Streptomyces rapamycinicus]RLV78439.1 LuxR family transcriptional regulator [Streptomyces rapamycinicus NRRL 5491]UTO66217.1 response regulator transcription factor [Streptomyces rapamycinicus]UTP34172.1 response regulator transcription factor [Streptomyces rapamycinicus NRRL 5
MTEPFGDSRTLRVVVADDQAAVREPLAAVLGLSADIEVVAAAADGSEVLTAVAAGPVDVVLMDLRMPVLDGTEATRRLSEEHPEVAVVVLTTFADDDSILAALSAGARGYLTKNAGRQDIVRAIRAAAAGQSVLDREVQDRLLATVRGKPTAAGSALPADLTPREREVLAAIGQGLPNRAIAEKLFISEATVKTHINNLFAKADIRDRADAVRRAIAAGLA